MEKYIPSAIFNSIFINYLHEHEQIYYILSNKNLQECENVFENIAITLLENGVSEKDALPIVQEKLGM